CARKWFGYGLDSW
nr:immunoglobulin heavy chain junction region [Macaca mulatta]